MVVRKIVKLFVVVVELQIVVVILVAVILELLLMVLMFMEVSAMLVVVEIKITMIVLIMAFIVKRMYHFSILGVHALDYLSFVIFLKKILYSQVLPDLNDPCSTKISLKSDFSESSYFLESSDKCFRRFHKYSSDSCLLSLIYFISRGYNRL